MLTDEIERLYGEDTGRQLGNVFENTSEMDIITL